MYHNTTQIKLKQKRNKTKADHHTSPTPLKFPAKIQAKCYTCHLSLDYQIPPVQALILQPLTTLLPMSKNHRLTIIIS